MNDTLSVVLITTILPDPTNQGGPSGLPWEILQVLSKDGWEVNVQLVTIPSGTISRRLMQMAIPLKQINIEKRNADLYIAYPFYVCSRIPVEFRSRTLVLGPDSTSMLYARFARIQSGWRRWRDLLLSRWFAYSERWAVKHCSGLIVVGLNDARWIKRIVNNDSHLKVHYLPHPVLSKVTTSNLEVDYKYRPRLIFGGDLSKKYVGDFFERIDYSALRVVLQDADCDVLVVGKGNKSLYDLLSNYLDVDYQVWVEEYSSLCNPLRDLHAIPLMAGAGTKNRTLTALAMNIVIISTSIGTENIDRLLLSNTTVHRFRSARDFPTSVACALEDLKYRRQTGYSTSVMSIDIITKNFRKSIQSIVKSVVINTSLVNKKNDSN